MPERGLFITVEGIEGAGKSTCLSVLSQRIEAARRSLIVTREPGGTPIGEELRALLLGHRHTGMSDDAELLLMFAARAEHLSAKIAPALASGAWVLCDRFTDATYAYQGGGRGIARSRIAALEQWVQGDVRPDLTILLDLPVNQGLARASKRSTPDRFESETRMFFERVRDCYRNIAANDPNRVKVVDASQPLSHVTEQLGQLIEGYLADVA